MFKMPIAFRLLAALGAFAAPVRDRNRPIPNSVLASAENCGSSRNGGKRNNRQHQRAAAKRRNVKRFRASQRG